jgi:3-hydroxymyristoyl/3-hydroxydecanoyl-(acyl carrier protein) dehydratase
VTFLFVDRIYEYQEKKFIRGIKNVTRNEGFFYWLPNGQRVLSPAVITEALAQLGSWLKIVSVDFTKRPVLLADEITTYHSFVEVGDQVDLFVEVLGFEDDVVVTSSRAEVRGRPVLTVKCCRGYMLPMEDFNDPEDVRRMFRNLYRPELKDVEPVADNYTRIPAIAGRQSFEALRFIDGLIKHEPFSKVTGFKNFTSCEPYFKDHFPRKPVVPGVLLMTFMGEVCQYLIKDELDIPLRSRALIPLYIQNVRFRKFVEPGDQCVLQAEIKAGDARQNNQEIIVVASIFANGKRVMTAEMGFMTMYGSQPLLAPDTKLKYARYQDSPARLD